MASHLILSNRQLKASDAANFFVFCFKEKTKVLFLVSFCFIHTHIHGRVDRLVSSLLLSISPWMCLISYDLCLYKTSPVSVFLFAIAINDLAHYLHLCLSFIILIGQCLCNLFPFASTLVRIIVNACTIYNYNSWMKQKWKENKKEKKRERKKHLLVRPVSEKLSPRDVWVSWWICCMKQVIFSVNLD